MLLFRKLHTQKKYNRSCDWNHRIYLSGLNNTQPLPGSYRILRSTTVPNACGAYSMALYLPNLVGNCIKDWLHLLLKYHWIFARNGGVPSSCDKIWRRPRPCQSEHVVVGQLCREWIVNKLMFLKFPLYRPPNKRISEWISDKLSYGDIFGRSKCVLAGVWIDSNNNRNTAKVGWTEWWTFELDGWIDKPF